MVSPVEALQARAPARFTGRQWVVLLVLVGTGFMLSVDFSILNVALPAAGAGVGLEPAQLPWITSAYALPAAGFTLLFGRLADLLGRRRLLLAGLALLAAASLLGGLATGAGTLLAARALQGLAAAMAIPAALSLLTTTFAEGPLRARALGLNGALACAGFTVGALVGGVLVGALSWRAAFFVNVPVALVVLAVAPLVVAESRRPARTRLDVPGAVTVTGGLLAVVYAVIERSLLVGAVGVLLLVAFRAIERRAPAPLVSAAILRHPPVRWGNVAGFVVFAVEPAVIFLMTLYLQEVLGLSPLATGLVFGVPGLAAVVAGIAAGRAIGRFGARPVLLVTTAVEGAAILPLLVVGPDPVALAVVVPALFVGFFGHVAAIVAVTVTATSGLPDAEQGLATGLTSMTQQVAISVGTPVLGAVAAAGSGLLAGIHLGLVVAVVAVLVGVLLVGRGLRDH
jgi:MFS family permease